MTHLNEQDVELLKLALRSLKNEVNESIDTLMKRFVAAEAGLKIDGTPLKRPGRPLGRKNNKKPAVRKTTPVVLKEAA